MIVCVTQLWRQLRSVRRLWLTLLMRINCPRFIAFKLGWNCQTMTWLSVMGELSSFEQPLFPTGQLLQTRGFLNSVWRSNRVCSSLCGQHVVGSRVEWKSVSLVFLAVAAGVSEASLEDLAAGLLDACARMIVNGLCPEIWKSPPSLSTSL